MSEMEKMGNINKIVFVVLSFITTNVHTSGQNLTSCEEAKNNNIHDSVITKILSNYRIIFDKQDDRLKNVPIYILNSNYIEPVAKTLNNCIILSESFFLTKAQELGFLITGDEELSQLDDEKLLTLLLGTFCHEMGHYTHQVMGVNLDSINNKFQRQQCSEYHVDLLSGYFAAKSLWENRKKQIGDFCSISDADIFRVILDVLRNNKESMNKALRCIYKFTNAYQHVSILEGSRDMLTHGYPISRKKAFDAGIYYALMDGIAKGEILNENIRKLIDVYLKLKNKTFEQVKKQFAVNIIEFLKEQRGIENLNQDVKQYPLNVLIIEGLKFVLLLPYAIPKN